MRLREIRIPGARRDEKACNPDHAPSLLIRGSAVLWRCAGGFVYRASSVLLGVRPVRRAGMFQRFFYSSDNVTTGKDSLRVTFTGDFCPRGPAEKIILSGKADQIFDEILPFLHDTDLLVMNMEAPLTRASTPIKKSGPNIRVDPGCVEALTLAGCDVAQIANNHIGDYGDEGVLETLEVLKRHDIKPVGAGAGLKQAQRPLRLCMNGRRISVLAFAENEFGIAGHGKPGVNPLDPLANIQQIRQAADESDVTIVLVHGGNETNPVPSPRMRDTYRVFASAGASAVVCGHTHCPQGIELWDGVPIVYSLGNFLFHKAEEYRPDDMWWRSFITRITLASGGVSVEILPFEFGPDATRIRLLSQDENNLFIDYLSHLSDIASDDRLSARCWDAWCAMHGPAWLRYLEGARWPLSADDEKAFQKLLTARNAFTCESHCELITHFLELARRHELSQAREYVPFVERLQTGKVGAECR